MKKQNKTNCTSVGKLEVTLSLIIFVSMCVLEIYSRKKDKNLLIFIEESSKTKIDSLLQSLNLRNSDLKKHFLFLAIRSWLYNMTKTHLHYSLRNYKR